MNSINKLITMWLDELVDYKITPYEELPDIDLYMDQVITYLEKQLRIFESTSQDKQITSSMINNYVKGDVIPSPIKKKYNKSHIALILEICALKKVLSIHQIKALFDEQFKDNKFNEGFNKFKEIEDAYINQIANETLNTISKTSENNIDALNDLALDLAIKAQVNLAISDRILFYVQKYKEKTEKKTKE